MTKLLISRCSAVSTVQMLTADSQLTRTPWVQERQQSKDSAKQVTKIPEADLDVRATEWS